MKSPRSSARILTLSIAISAFFIRSGSIFFSSPYSFHTEIHPLLSARIFLLGEFVSDDNPQHIIARRKVLHLQPPAIHQTREIFLAGSIHLARWELIDAFAVTEEFDL